MEQIVTNVLKPELKFESKKTEYRYINKDVEQELDTKINDVREYMNENHGKGKSAKEKDNLYLQSQKIWTKFLDVLKDAKYNFYLNKEQWKFLTDLILNKLEYDVNTVFFAIELKSLFQGMKETKYKNDDEFIPYPVNATEVTYIYHLISKHTVKGLTRDSYTFSEILLTIANISKIFNYYDATGKNLSSDVQDWVSTFEDGVNFEEKRVTETI
jgi:hypothetical protein